MEDLIRQFIALLKGVWKYRAWALVTSWAALTIGTVAVYLQHDQYPATARVFVDTASILRPLLAGMTTIPNTEQQVSIMSRTLLTRPNVEKVIRITDLDLNAKSVKEHEALVESLLSQIKIAGTVQNDIYTISYTADNPQVVKNVVQAFMTIFLEGSFGDKRQDSEKAVRFINEQIKSYEAKLVEAETALKNFKIQNMGLLPKQGGDYGSKLIDTADALNQAKLDLREAEQARDAIRREINGIPSGAKEERPSSATLEMDARLQTLHKSLDGLLLQYTEAHPDIVSTRRLIAQLEASRNEEIQNRKAGIVPSGTYSPVMHEMTLSLANAEARVASMRARVDEYASRDSRLKKMNSIQPEIEQKLAQLNRDYTVNKENYEKLLASREAAKLSGDISATTEMMTFRVIDPPVVPLAPTGPNRARLETIVFLVALALGIAVATLMSRVRPTFISMSELRTVTNMPVLGSAGLNWTPIQAARHKKTLLVFSTALAMLVVVYGALVTHFVLKF